ncbi:MAG: ABC transporter ATP-binding protein [Spirochaetales bacterium]|nr:ABC transporter ATP-binding protein [Spirochaetales bacterium]
MDSNNVIELRGITKRFGAVTANEDVDLTVKEHEILSILGENGSGKTTLMNILSGIYRPDEGEIIVKGTPVTIHSPKDALALNIGMVHQHYTLVNVFTAAENIVLGLEGKQVLDMPQILKTIRNITDSYGFELDLNQKIYDMSVSQKQTVEIVKALYRGADVLILDEPTAVLTPQETQKLFTVLRNMKEAGKSIIIITHKLNEVLTISDRVAVLRKGKNAGTLATKESTVQLLAENMVGEKVSLDIKRDEPTNQKLKLKVDDLNYITPDGHKMLDHVSFEANSGEMLGVAGISGSGMKELLEAIAGIQTVESGVVHYYKDDDNEYTLTGMDPSQIRKLGVALSFVPEDRLGMGLVGSMGMTDNVMLRSYQKGKTPFVDRDSPKERSEKLIELLEISTPGTETPVRRLSGGNVQKVLVGREISSRPEVLLVAYPVRGLDIHSSYNIYNLLNEQKKRGVAVICVIEDLDVLLELCDRIIVMNNGRITGERDAKETTKDEIGMLMTSSGEMQSSTGKGL